MNPIFTNGRKFAEPMREAEIALRNNQRAAIVLAVVDDPFATPDYPHLLRTEAMAELAERLFGKYAFYEFNAATATQLSIPRFCRDLRERPACVFVYGLEALALTDKSRYLNVLQLLNNHREDIRDTCTALVLWMSPATHKDVVTHAPDFADWRAASVAFKANQEDATPQTTLGSLPIAEADALRHEAQRFEEMLQQTDMEPTLAAEFYRQLGQIRSRLGQEQESLQALREAARLAAETFNLEQMEQIYLEYLQEQYGYLNPRGISQTVKSVTLPLDEVYVSLTAEREVEQGWLSIDFDVPLETTHIHISAEQVAEARARQPQRYSEKIDLPRAVRESARMVVLGDPGAGKTTLAKFLTVCFARACRDGRETTQDKEGNDYGYTRLPVLLRVADYAEALRHNPGLALQTYLIESCHNVPLTHNAINSLFQQAFANGRMFVILDGLDEVADAITRLEIARRIENFVTGMAAGNRALVTSRIAGYNEARLSAGFQQFTLRDMEPEQIARFLERWCAAVERFHTPDASATAIQQRMTAEKTALLRAVEANEGVRRLAGNPLLLTILALIHRNNARLPERRIELYDLATRTLLRDWRLANAGMQARTVDEAEAQELLGPLAYEMHESEPTGLISEERASELLCLYYATARGRKPEDTDVQVAIADFLRRVREHTGLFVERAPGKYGFMHLTFEEYFAAREIVSDFTQAAQRIREHKHQARWEEVIRLAIASERPKNAAHLIRAAIWNNDGAKATTGYVPSEYEDILRRDLMLAARCLGDCEAIEPILARQIADELTDICLNRSFRHNYDPLRRRVYVTLPALDSSEIGLEMLRQLRSALQDERWAVRGRAATALGQVGQASKDTVPPLLIALQDTHPFVRQSAIAALGWLNDASENVVTALLNHLDDKESSVRHSAATALGRLGNVSENVVTALLNHLQNGNRNARLSAIAALGRLGNQSKKVAMILLNHLQHSNREERRSVISALGRLGNVSEKVVTALLNLLKDNAGDVRQNAVASLGQLGNASDRVVAALISLSKDRDKKVRQSVAAALGRLGTASDKVEIALFSLLNDEESYVRQSTVTALGKLANISENVVTTLVSLLNDSNEQVQVCAAKALGSVDNASEKVIITLLNLLQSRDDSVRLNTATTLGELGYASENIITALLHCLQDEQGYVQDAAWEALNLLVQS